MVLVVTLVAFAMANTGYTYGYHMSYIDRVEIRQHHNVQKYMML